MHHKGSGRVATKIEIRYFTTKDAKNTKEEIIFSSIQCPILSGLRDLRDLRGDEINAKMLDSPPEEPKKSG